MPLPLPLLAAEKGRSGIKAGARDQKGIIPLSRPDADGCSGFSEFRQKGRVPYLLGITASVSHTHTACWVPTSNGAVVALDLCHTAKEIVCYLHYREKKKKDDVGGTVGGQVGHRESDEIKRTDSTMQAPHQNLS